MKTFRTKKINVKLECACLNPVDFSSIEDYYTFVTSDVCYSKVHGYYTKRFFMLRPKHILEAFFYDASTYDSMPRFVCVSVLY